MKLTTQQIENLKCLLQNRRIYTEEVVLGRFSSAYNKFYSSFSSLFKLLCEENIIKEDPYKKEYSLSTLEPPDETPIPFNEEEYAITIRLSHYHAILEHIKENVSPSLEFLTVNRIERVKKVITFLDWERLLDLQPNGVNSEALNKIIFLYKKDRGHTYVTSTLKSTNKNIEIYSKELLKEISEIALYKSEEYKLFIREEILPDLKLPPEIKGENIKKAHDMISGKIKSLNEPLYINLIGEILKEDFTTDGERIRTEIFNKLDITNIDQSKKIKTEKKVSKKDLLANSLLELAKISSQAEPTQLKLEEDTELFRDSTYNLLDKFFDYLKYTLLLKKRETIYPIKVVEKKNDNPIEKKLHFEKFIYTLHSLHKKLESYRSKESPEFTELFLKKEDDIQLVIHQLISKSRYCYKVATGLDKFFKENIDAPKGIQVELKAIHSLLDKSQAYYLEFVKLKDKSH